MNVQFKWWVRVLIVLGMCLWGAQIVWAGQARYVFLFVGDGMGLAQRSLAEAYLGRRLLMNSFPVQGITTTSAADRFITGSAPAATALASGQKTNVGVVGMDPELRPVRTIAEMAKAEGKKVGIVTSVSLDHATPAAFYAHVPRRSQYYHIDVALAESGFDYFGGGGLKDPTNSGGHSKSFQGNAWELAAENGYTVVREKEVFMELKPGVGKVLASNSRLQRGQALPYALDRRPWDISLAEFTAKGIELLDNEQGFFMMVEGGKIDWAGHANDGAACVHDVLAFDRALAKAYAFYLKHRDETLIVVTGDHECGGMSLGYAGTGYATDFALLSRQQVSGQKFAQSILAEFKAREQDTSFAQLQPIISRAFGLKFGGALDDPMRLQPHEVSKIRRAYARSMAGEVEGSNNLEAYLQYGGEDPLAVTLTHILNHKAGIAWTSYKHTGVPVITSAVGVEAERFDGFYDNTDIGLKMMDIMGFEPMVHPAVEVEEEMEAG